MLLQPTPPGGGTPDAPAELAGTVDVAEADSAVLWRKWTARQIAALPDPSDEDFLCGPLVRRGMRLLIAGGTGEGKTTFTYQLVAATVTGRPFLVPEWVGVGGRALILDAEQHEQDIKRLVLEAGLATNDNVDIIAVPDGLALDREPEHRRALEKDLVDGGYDVVVVDPFYKLHGGDSSEERAMVDFLKVLDRWRQRYAFALIVPAHTRKPQPGYHRPSINDVFGSSAVCRGAETVVGLQLVADGHSRLHFLKARSGHLPTRTYWNLRFDRQLGFTRDPNDSAPSAKQQILAELRNVAPETRTQKQLAAATGKTERTVRDALKQLVQEGHVKRGERNGSHGEVPYWAAPESDQT